MNSLAWIKPMLTDQVLDMPSDFQSIINRGTQKQSPFYFSTATEGSEDTDRMNAMYPGYRVVAFGRRLDYDGVVCLVVGDGKHPKGSIIILHWDGGPGTEIDDHYPSLAAWAKAAADDIAEWAR